MRDLNGKENSLLFLFHAVNPFVESKSYCISFSVCRGVTRTILGRFTKRNVSLGGSGGKLPQKKFDNR